MREHVEAAVKIARLTLRASAEDGAQEDLDELAARIEAAPELPPWAGGWKEASEWTDERVPHTPNEDRARVRGCIEGVGRSGLRWLEFRSIRRIWVGGWC
jgi:hypothetical protein